MRRDPRVGLSVTDATDPYRMAAIQGRVTEVRRDQDCRYMDPGSDRGQIHERPGPAPRPRARVLRNRRRAGRRADAVLRAQPIAEMTVEIRELSDVGELAPLRPLWLA